MRFLAIPLAAVLALTAYAAPVPKEKPKTTADKLVGTWKLVKSSNGSEKRTSLTVEFTRAGEMTITQQVGDGDPLVLRGTYKLDGDKLPYTWTSGDSTKDETLTIKTLTDGGLVLVDPDDISEEFERVPPKK